MTRLLLVTSGTIKLLRDQLNTPLQTVATSHIPDDALQRVLKHVGYLDLAADALAMRPRPGWLEAIVGPHPILPKPHGQPWPDCENTE